MTDHEHTLKCIDRDGVAICGQAHGEIFLKSKIRKGIAAKGQATRRANKAAIGPCPSRHTCGWRSQFLAQCQNPRGHTGEHKNEDRDGRTVWSDQLLDGHLVYVEFIHYADGAPSYLRAGLVRYQEGPYAGETLTVMLRQLSVRK